MEVKQNKAGDLKATSLCARESQCFSPFGSAVTGEPFAVECAYKL